jgi:hypothetical protein
VSRESGWLKRELKAVVFINWREREWTWIEIQRWLDYLCTAGHLSDFSKWIIQTQKPCMLRMLADF